MMMMMMIPVMVMSVCDLRDICCELITTQRHVNSLLFTVCSTYLDEHSTH